MSRCYNPEIDYWKTNPEWFGYMDDEEGTPYLTDKAPPEAVKSFEKHKEYEKSIENSKILI